MAKSLKYFLNGIIDYAGIFPPAKLSLEDSFKNFIEYKSEDTGWILSNFICPAVELKKLEDIIKFSSTNITLPLSLIVKGGDSAERFLEEITDTLQLIKDFTSRNPGSVKINCLEVKLPAPEINPERKIITELLNKISINVKNILSENIFLFYESPSSDNIEDNFKDLIETIEEHNEEFKDSGFKLRTGGVEASLYPASDQIVYALRQCIERGVSFKATAGLHHPFRHYNESVKTKMHGFINLFGAGIIAYRHNITDKELVKMLEEEDPSEFKFTDEAFTYEGWEISNDEIALARKEFMISFGSCSVEEPIDDLKKIWIN